MPLHRCEILMHDRIFRKTTEHVISEFFYVKCELTPLVLLFYAYCKHNIRLELEKP